MPNFWERPEMSGLLRDVIRKPAPYAWLDDRRPVAKAADVMEDAGADEAEPDAVIAGLLRDLRTQSEAE